MISKRVLVVSGDKAIARQLAAGLMAAGANADIVASAADVPRGEIEAALVAMHLADGDLRAIGPVADRLREGASMIVVIPTSSLQATVEAMKHPAVRAVLVADDLQTSYLASVATRLLYGDVFGVEKVMPWGVKIYSVLVGDYQEKSVAIAAVNDFASAMGVRRKYRESIEQCLDEMLMNALYDAPVDAEGKQMFSEIPTKSRISLRTEQKAVVQYACDGRTFAMSVRDSYGSLKRETVIKYLDKCLHSEQQIDRKAGGAGLGLYIISNAATQFITNIYPGVATEALCTFDLTAPKVQLKELGIFHERIDSSARLVGGVSRRATGSMPAASVARGGTAVPQSRGLTVLLSFAVILLLALVGIVAYPRFAGTPKSAIAVASEPPGAQIELDGQLVGTTSDGPLQIPDLDVGQKYRITARLDGYEIADQIVSPQKDVTAPVTLTLAPKAAVVLIETDPPGATVRVGEEELGQTPVTVTRFPAGSQQTLSIEKTGYESLTREIKVPAPGRESSVYFPLAVKGDFASVRIESDPAGARVYQNGELLAGLTTPVAEHLVEAGRLYKFTLAKSGFMPETIDVRVKAGERKVPVKARLRPGGTLTVRVNVDGAKISVSRSRECRNVTEPMERCPLPNGTHKVVIESRKPYVNETLTVRINGNHVERAVDLGFVETASEGLSFKLKGAPKGTRRLALAPGRQKVTLVTEDGEAVDRTVTVVAGRTVTVDGN